MKSQSNFALTRIILFSGQVAELKSFYVRHFNFAVVEEISDQWVVLNAGAVEIAIHKIGQANEPTRGEKFEAWSNTKIVFRTTGDLKSVRQELIDNGVPLGEIKIFGDVPSSYCDGKDPEGNVFQLVG